LQTHNTIFFEDSMGGFERPYSPYLPLWVRQCLRVDVSTKTSARAI